MGVKVSIIIPVLNEQEHIEEAIERAWAARPHEVIVVDGGSSDPTFKLAARRRCQLLGGPRGRAVQQNYGARHATGNVLLFLHADTWLEPAALHQVEAVMAAGYVPGGAFWQRIEAPGPFYRLLEYGNALRARAMGAPYGDQGIFVRKSLFAQMGGFPAVALMEDLLFMRRFRRRGWPVLLPGPLHVSARRWKRHGPVRQTLRNWLLLGAEHVGVAPDRLADFYAAR